MIHSHNLLCTITILQKLITFIENSSLTAVQQSSYVLELYKQVRNENSPLESDFAYSRADIRRQICADISDSYLFAAADYIPADQEEIMMSYAELFSRIYRLRGDTVEYVNACVPQMFKLADFSQVLSTPFQEYVFACPFKSRSSGPMFVHYVSREYNVVEGSSRTGRFLFLERADRPHFDHTILLLAEEPAISYAASTEFNIELLYLLRRKNRPAGDSSARTNEADPLCKLIVDGPSNQELRLCTMVLSSVYFRQTIKNLVGPYVGDFYGCVENKVGFQTKEASGEATTPYAEYMTRCTARTKEHRFKYFYISRAYESGEVFVFQYDHSARLMYLESLTVKVDIVVEPSTLDSHT